MHKKIVIFFGTPEDFDRVLVKQFRDEIWRKGIGSALYNIDDLNSQTGCEEVIGTYEPHEAVVCCFQGIKCDAAEKILKNLSLTVVVAIPMDIMDYAVDILGKFKS